MACPCRVNSPARCFRRLQVQRNADIGSPRDVGSTRTLQRVSQALVLIHQFSAPGTPPSNSAGIRPRRWTICWRSKKAGLTIRACIAVWTAFCCNKTKLERHLKERYGALFGAEFDVLLYDLTSTFGIVK